jgi:hypothetical protein|tara:strand:- start:1863 stop:2378 length:516 start_codon:yes stop_codon:yes gene_type:complete
MAGSLIKIGNSVASGTPSVLTITGIDSTFDVYLVQVKGIVPSSDNTIAWRITKGGSIQTDSEYDNARKDMPATASFQNNGSVNQTSVTNADIESTQNGFFANFYLFNFANTGEYSFATFETVSFVSTPQLFGGNGGFVHTVASASDGLSFFFTGGATINNGAELVLYGLKK